MHTPEALTNALRGKGWSYTSEVRIDLEWHCRIHDLESPDQRLRIEVSEYIDHAIAKLSAAARAAPDPTPGWTVDLEVPVPIALAAVQAAAGGLVPEMDEATQLARSLDQNTGPHLVAAMLTAKGWQGEAGPDEDRDGRMTDIEWVSPDGERSACWNEKDAFGPGGWTITHGPRDGLGLRAAETYASQHTPAAVIAALALTDDTAASNQGTSVYHDDLANDPTGRPASGPMKNPDAYIELTLGDALHARIWINGSASDAIGHILALANPAPSAPVPRRPGLEPQLRPLLEAGLLTPGQELTWHRPRLRRTEKATVRADGRLEIADGTAWPSPFQAAHRIAGHPTNGWLRFTTADGRSLHDLKTALANREPGSAARDQRAA